MKKLRQTRQRRAPADYRCFARCGIAIIVFTFELGQLMSFGGVGALASALFTAAFNHRISPRRLLIFGAIIFVVGITLFALVKSFHLALAMLAVAGFGIILFYINANSSLQKRVPNHLRGRMMGVYAFAFGGLSPLGNLLIGFAGEKIGPPLAVVGGAVICAVMAYFVSRSMFGNRKE